MTVPSTGLIDRKAVAAEVLMPSTLACGKDGLQPAFLLVLLTILVTQLRMAAGQIDFSPVDERHFDIGGHFKGVP